MTQPSLTSVEVLARVVGMGLVSGVVAGTVALVHRWYARERVPGGLTMLTALATVALYLNTSDALRTVMGGGRDLLDLEVAFVNAVVFGVAAVAAPLGGRLGDHVATSMFAVSGARELEGEVSRIVQSVGRVITVTLPEDITDMDDYDPVPAATKADLAGKTLVFPRRLTVGELRDRLLTRLKTDYGVGHVDLELSDDGTVEYLAVGSRAAGIGPTLPPGSVVVSVRGDPAFSASPGDLVQIWQPGSDPERVATAELRATVDDVVTVAIDAADADRLDSRTRYRLVTLPAEPRADREFASLLRSADETMGVVTVGADSPLAGAPVGALDVVTVAVRPEGGRLETVPSRSRVLSVGDTVYAIGRPETLRKFETAATVAATAATPDGR